MIRPCLIKDFYHLLRGLNQPDPPFSLSLMVYGTWFPRSCGVEEARVVIWKKQIDPNCQFLASLQRVRKGFGRFYLDSLGLSDRPVSNPLCFCRFLSRPGPSLLQLRFSCSLLFFSILSFPRTIALLLESRNRYFSLRANNSIWRGQFSGNLAGCKFS